MFLFHKWLGLSLSTRQKIAADFGIQKKGAIEVFNNTVKSDGYEIKDIEEKLNLDAIQTYLGTNVTDFAELWTLLVDKTEGRVVTPIDIEVVIVPTPEGEKIPLEVLKTSWCDTCDSKGVRHKLGCPKYKPTK